MLGQRRILSIALLALATSSYANNSMKHHYYSGNNEREQVYKHNLDPAPVDAAKNSAMYTQGPTVTTSPYLGIRSAFDAHDLIVNMPTMNEDLRLLKQQSELKHKLGCLPYVHRPLVEISGDVLGQISYFEKYDGTSSHDVNLSGARLDALGEVSEWALGYISINYDDSRLPSNVEGSGFRLKNSRLFLKRGFLTIGDLDCSPVYFSIGQMFVPFGRYSSGIVSSTVTSKMAKTNARAALLGFYHQGFFASVYTFRGDSTVGDTGINQWGLNAGYELSQGSWSGQFGAGYIANIADSDGFQCPGTSEGFVGFAFDRSSEQLEQRVPAYNIHAKVNYDGFSGIVEFVNTTRPFSILDISYNGKGARMNALQLELQANQEICDYNVLFALSYGHTCDALALGMPEHSYIAAVSTSIWKNTIESLEYRHDCNYSKGDRANGNASADLVSVGGSRNSIVGQIGVYF